MRNLHLSINSNEFGQVIFAETCQADQLVNYRASDSLAEVNQNFYTEFYTSDKNPLKITREIQFSKLVRVIKSFLNSSEKKILLDIGCGQGDFVKIVQSLLPTQIEAYGIEPSISHETKNLKKLTLEQVQVSATLPRKFDLITALDVFEHFPNPSETLNKISNLLNENGQLILMVPNKDSLLYRIGKVLVPIFPTIANKFFGRLYQIQYPPPHFYYYNATSLKLLLNPGFEVQYVGYQSQLPLKGIPTRFWGVSKSLKPFFIIAALFYRIFSPYSLNDSLVIIAKKVKNNLIAETVRT